MNRQGATDHMTRFCGLLLYFDRIDCAVFQIIYQYSPVDYIAAYPPVTSSTTRARYSRVEARLRDVGKTEARGNVICDV